MGSSLFPNYTLDKKPYLELKFWKIFKGTNKTTGDNISAFIFEKKILDKKSEKERDNILMCLRKEPETLIRGKNKHKNFLTIIEPIKEDNSSIGFITEYISYNLISWINDYHPSKLEIKYIIYQILSVVFFIHSEYHISHNNLNPENIFITEKNFIKITGFMFTTSLIKDTNNNNNNNNLIFSKNIVKLVCNLKYASPDLIINNEINNNSDNFLIGLISYYLLNEKNNYNDLFVLNDNSYESYKNSYENTNIDKKVNNFTKDDYVKEFLKLLLQNNPEKRKNLSQIQNSKFFVESEDNNKLVPLCLLSKMESTEISSNYDLLKLLPNILNLYSKKEKEFLILPNLLYYLKVENLINPIVPALFLLSEQNNKDINFEEKIWPTFKKLFNMKKFPAATLYFTLKKMNFLINNLEKSEFNKYCIPLMSKALDCGVQKIQEVVLDELPNLLKNLDKNEFQNNIYNRLVKIVIQTNNKKIRKKIMNFFIYLTDYFDSYFINNNFLEDIEKIIKSETTINICKNAFILYEKIKLKVNDKSVRSKIIPSLLLMMCNGEISEDLFNQGERIIHSYIQKIKEKRKDQFVQEVESDSDEKNIKNNNEINNANIADKNPSNINSIGINSPLSVTRTKSTLSGNISLFECNSSEDSGFGLDDKNKVKKEKIEKAKKDKIKKAKNNNSNNNNNLFDNLLNDNNEDEYKEYNKNNDSSFDSESVGKNKNKNDFDFLSKKEFLSSLELKRIEAKKKLENKETEKKVSKFNENKKNPWEEIESDDEITDELDRYIKPKKSKEENNENNSLSKKEKEKEEKSDKKKKWDEDEDEDENYEKLNNQKNENKNNLEELLLLNNEDENKQIKKPINSNPINIVNTNIIEEKKDEKNELNNDKDKDKDKGSPNKKKGLKKKKKHKKKEKTEKINDNDNENKEKKDEKKEVKIIEEKKEEKNGVKEKDEKNVERQISTSKMRMEKRAATLDLDNLLADDD